MRQFPRFFDTVCRRVVLFALVLCASFLLSGSPIDTVDAISDADLDGIADSIDVDRTNSFADQSLTPSTLFSDEHLGGVSYGAVTDPGGVTFEIDNLPQPAGFSVTASGGGAAAIIRMCALANVAVNSGVSLELSCDDLEVSVLSGHSVITGGMVEVYMPEDTSITVTNSGFLSIANSAASAEPVLANRVEVPPGSSDDDRDSDGFLTSTETAVGTSPTIACTGNNWPPDITGNQVVNILDVVQLTPPVTGAVVGDAEYSTRIDLRPDGVINLLDLSIVTPPVFGTVCFSLSPLAATSYPAPESVELVAVDVDTTGNDDTAVGTIESCGLLTGAGDSLTFDVIARGVKDADRLKGYQIDLGYDPTVLNVTGLVAVDASGSTAPNDVSMISRLPSGAGIGFLNLGEGGEFPDDDGILTLIVIDSSSDGDSGVPGVQASPAMHESGEGVLARITVTAVSDGVSPLLIPAPSGGMDGLPDAMLVGGRGAHENRPVPVDTILSGVIGVGVSPDCDDGDGDGVVDFVDNCPVDPNAGQTNFDGDADGDACDTDDDNDGFADGADTCPQTPLGASPVDANGCSQAQVDSDLDGVCNPGSVSTLCGGSDDCPSTAGGQTVDANGCSQAQVDGDLDGICDPGEVSTLCSGSDNCPTTSNPGQQDFDGDSLGDTCDPDDDNDGIDDSADGCDNDPEDFDGFQDADGCSDPDNDGDGVDDALDNCPTAVNTDQANHDADPDGDACDNDDDDDGVDDATEATAGSDPINAASTPEVCDGVDNDLNDGIDEGFDNDGDTIADCFDPDDDNDGVADGDDNCPIVANATQSDFDADGVGDHCDDLDGDSVFDAFDNCDFVFNPDQTNSDGDSRGDACDPDDDNDGVFDAFDNCPTVSNPGQDDIDADGVGDACADMDGDGVADSIDNCITVPNPGQEDFDGDGNGDACDSDEDGDTIIDIYDNCPSTPNLDQANSDGDGYGNACDNCPTTPNPAQDDFDDDGLGDLCDADDDNDGIVDTIDGTWSGSSFTDQSLGVSDLFTDQHLSGTSFGEVLDRSTLVLTITDLASPDGFFVAATGSDGPATVRMCDLMDISVPAGASFTLDACGSVYLTVIQGTIVGWSGTLQVIVPSGSSIAVQEISSVLQITNAPSSSANIVVNGVTLAPGGSGDDRDSDAYLTSTEALMGTNPDVGCGLNAWPPDFDDNQVVNILDIVQMTPPVFGSAPPNANYTVRKDFDGNMVINILDLVRITPPVFGSTCT